MPANRQFVMSTYKDLKTANPTFPILVREAENVKARLIARYGKSACCRPACHPLVAYETLTGRARPSSRCDVTSVDA